MVLQQVLEETERSDSRTYSYFVDEVKLLWSCLPRGTGALPKRHPCGKVPLVCLSLEQAPRCAGSREEAAGTFFLEVGEEPPVPQGCSGGCKLLGQEARNNPGAASWRARIYRLSEKTRRIGKLERKWTDTDTGKRSTA